MLKFFLYHMFIPTSAVVFITIISSVWIRKFFGGYCFELCTCVRFFRDCFWWSWSCSWNSGLDYKTGVKWLWWQLSLSG